MVSDFIDEYTGFLALTEDEHTQGKVKYPDLQQEAWTILKYGANHEGYWTWPKLVGWSYGIYSLKVDQVLWFTDCSYHPSVCGSILSMTWSLIGY